MINNYLIKGNNKIRDAIKLLNSVNRNCLIVIDEKKRLLEQLQMEILEELFLKKEYKQQIKRFMQ